MIRKIDLAREANTVINLLSGVFQYPDHPEWNVQENTIRNLQKQASAYRWLSPIINLIPSYKKRIQGLFYEEQGKLVGIALFFETLPTIWYIAYIGVLPQNRREGIGRNLLDATVAAIVNLGGKQITLDVQVDNIPAENLYKQVGFKQVTQRLYYVSNPSSSYPITEPLGYRVDITSKRDWKVQNSLAKKIIPAEIMQYRPNMAELYKPNRFALISKSLIFLSGYKSKFILLRGEEHVVGWALLHINRKRDGTNRLEIMSLPNNATAAYLLSISLEQARKAGATTTGFALSAWQIELNDVANQMCTLKRVDNTLGLSV